MFRTRKLLGLTDPDPQSYVRIRIQMLLADPDPDAASDPESFINKKKKIKKNLDFYSFETCYLFKDRC
jgi:hypothetical protein